MIEWIVFHIILVVIFCLGVKYQADADKHVAEARKKQIQELSNYGYDIQVVN